MKNYKLFKTLLVLIGILIGSVSSQMWGATLTQGQAFYAHVNNCSQWKQSSATVRFELCNSSNETLATIDGTGIGSDYWYCEVSVANVEKVCLHRMGNDWTNDWGQSDYFAVESGKNCIELIENNWSWNNCTWSALTTNTIYVTPASLTYSNSESWDSSTRTLKANIKIGDSEYIQRTMQAVGKNYNGKAIYKTDFFATYSGVHVVQFQLYDGSTWKGQHEFDKANNSWEFADCLTNIKDHIYTSTNTWVSYAYDVTVSFNLQGHGSAIDSQTFLNGGTVSTPSAPSATGYMFGGWYEEPECTNAWNFSSTIDANKTLYAKWTAITISATVTPTAGATGASKNFTFTITSNVPTSSGYYVGVYNFGGVNAGNHGAGEMNGIIAYNSNPTEYSKNDVGGFSTAGTYTTHAFVMKESVVQATSADITYTAGDYYSVTFDLQGHGSAIDEQDIASGSKATKPDDPSATGYDFGGWFKEAGCSNEWDFDEETVTANTILYAKWTGKDYDVILDANGGSSDQTVTARYGSGMPSTLKAGGAIVAPTRAGYIFQGYFANNDGTGTQYYTSALASNHNWDVASADQHIYAHWINAPAVTTPMVSRSTIDVDGTTPLTISATSTYLANPVVIFTISDGTNSYKLTASTGAIGSGPTYSTVHKATFTPPTSGTWTVTATTLYEGKLIDNMGTNSVYWETAGSGGSYSKGLNPHTQAGTKYANDSVIQIRRNAGGDTWGGSLTKKALNTPYGYTGWSYVHTMQYRTAEGETKLKVNDGGGCSDDRTATSALSTGTWQEVMYNIGSCTFDFAFIQPSYGNTTDYTVYVDDIILLKESSLASAQKASVASSVAITAYQTYTVTLTSATEASVSAGQATGVSITASYAADGKKFDHWAVTSGASVASSTSRTTTVTATAAGTATAVYTDRTKRKIYFKAPGGDWNPPYAYLWDADGSADDYNAAYPGVAMSTETVDCVEYYYYEYIVDDNGEGDDLRARLDWDKVIFNKGSGDHEYPEPGWDKTRALNVENGHFYFYHCAAGSTGSAYGTDWYLQGNFNTSDKWNSWEYPIDITCATNTGYIDMASLSNENEQYFHIYQITTDKKFRITSSTSNAEVTMSTEYTLHNQSSGADYFTPAATTTYRFTLNVEDPSNPVLTVRPASDANYGATLAVSGHGSITPGAGAVTLHQYTPTTITATPEPGYRFVNWTVSGSASVVNASATTTTVTATAAGATITANFTNEGIIYLDKTNISGWTGTPYVYFYSGAYWNNEAGAGSKTTAGDANVPYSCIDGSHAMTRIGDSQIWYYDYSSLLGNKSSGTSRQYVAFTDHDQANHNWFVSCQAIYRSDFYPDAPMLIMSGSYTEKKNNNTVQYYTKGVWSKYNDTDPGIVLKVFNGSGNGGTLIRYAKFAAETAGDNTFYANIDLTYGNQYFKLEGCDTTTINTVNYAGTWYSNNGTMTNINHENWPFWNDVSNNCGINLTSTGTYKFILSLGNGVPYLTVDYPLAVNDYRVVYSGKVTTAGSTKTRGSTFIRSISNSGSGKDTVSFFVTGDWSLTLQKCTSTATNPPTWENACVSGYTLTASDLGLSGKTGVYMFEVEQGTGEGCDGVTIRCVGEYDKNYYIRTDIASGGWEAYKKSVNNIMIYSDYAKSHSGFDHYHCHYIPTDKNVKFVIANDYSACISDTVLGDTYVPAGTQKLPYQANVRFMWNSATNASSRAYLNGSSDGAAEYLKIASDPSKTVCNDAETKANNAGIIDKNGVMMVNNDTTFEDLGNWVYQIDLKALEGARVKLTSDYRFNSTSHLQYFKGADGSGSWDDEYTEQIMGGTANEYHLLRIVYDFKTNHMLSAWLVDQNENITTTRSVYSDVMILRSGHDDAKQITFGADVELDDVDTVYSVIELKKSHILGNGSQASREFYWVSFPYNVKINDIFGSVGNFNIDWAIQYYNGKKRAQNGYWIDSEPNWEFFESDTATLKANEGYVLTLALSKFLKTGIGSKWDNDVDSLYLYFPSAGKVGTILEKNVTLKIDTVGYKCTIDRTGNNGSDINKNRTIADSHWHCIGIPSFANVSRPTGTDWTTSEGESSSITDADDIPSIDTWTSPSLLFLYSWNMTTNKLEPVTAASYSFKAMHAYLVQYGNDTIQWKAVSTPNGIAARRISAIKDQEFRLEVRKNDVVEDHTYIRFSDKEGVTTGFEFGQDLSKELNKNSANIYTFADYVPVAGNSMPLETEQTTIVPMGVKIATNGEYTFSMPEGTNGIGVILVDNVTGTRTNLALTDYTVTLANGTYDGRFTLEVSAIQQTPTDVENGVGANGVTGVRKAIVDGVLYIVKDGVVFDARGNRVQ